MTGKIERCIITGHFLVFLHSSGGSEVMTPFMIGCRTLDSEKVRWQERNICRHLVVISRKNDKKTAEIPCNNTWILSKQKQGVLTCEAGPRKKKSRLIVECHQIE